MEDYIILIFIGVIAIVILISSFFNKKAVVKRKLKQAKHKRISEFLNDDTARITGIVELVGEPLVAPLSKRICAYYHVLVEIKKSTGNNRRWQTHIEEEESGKFLIKNEFGYAYINANKIKSYIVKDKNYSSGFFNDAKKHLENYLASHGKESEGLLGFNKTLRYKEGILEPDEKVAVLGKGQWKDAEVLGLPEKYGRVLEMSNYIKNEVYLSDDPDTTSNKKQKSIFSKIIDILTK